MSSSEFESSQGSVMFSSDTSTGPSRLDSFSSSGGIVQSNDFNMQTSFGETDKEILPPMSPVSSSCSSHGRMQREHSAGMTSTTNSNTDQSYGSQAEIDELEIVEAERAVSPMIQKWVDESCVETERLKSTYGEIPPNEKCEDFVEESNPSSEFALQQALEYSLRAVSPNLLRTTSIDANFSSQMTSTENLLLGLGFGGPDLGIPVRFMKSWREHIIKRRISELQGLLGRSMKSPSPNGSAKQYTSTKQKHLKEISKPKPKPKYQASVLKDTKVINSEEFRTKHQPVAAKSVVEPSEKQLQLEKVKAMRQQLQKSATFSHFSPNLFPDLKHNLFGKELRRLGAMSEKKYQKFRGATRGSAKDRRRMFGTRQSSLPISLETLPEEDEGGPTFLPQKSSSFDYLDNTYSAAVSSTTSANSSKLDVSLEGIADAPQVDKNCLEELHRNGPKIITSVPSSSSDGQPDSFDSEAGRPNNKFDGQHLLAIKKIIESKDSGFGNDISNEGTPEYSPEHHSEIINSYVDDISIINTKESHNLHMAESQMAGASGKGNNGHGIITGERVDLCIQVDIPNNVSDSEVLYSNTGVQTSPMLHSGELSPLCCGSVNPDDSLGVTEAPPISDDTIVDRKDGDKLFVTQLNDTCVLKNDISCPNDSKIDDENEGKDDYPQEEVNLSPNGLNFPDGFNAEKRRLSRIEEDMEKFPSHQSEEERIMMSLESQQDSSQATSTCSSSRPSSCLVISDLMKENDELHPENSGKVPHADFKKAKKKVYKEMLARNVTEDLEEKLMQVRANQQIERCSALPTVDETLRRAAEKLHFCVTDDDYKEIEMNNAQKQECCLTEVEKYYKGTQIKGATLEVCVMDEDQVHDEASDNELELNDIPEFTSHIRQNEILEPLHEYVFQRKNTIESLHPRSIGTSPKGSMKSRRFFASNSFSSFTDHVLDSGGIDTPEWNASELASTFSMPVDDINFSLTGNDMNLLVAEKDSYYPDSRNDGITLPGFWKDQSQSGQSSTDSVPSTASTERKSQQYSEERSLGVEGTSLIPALSSQIEPGAFFSETINDDVTFQKKIFTEILEINVPSAAQVSGLIISEKCIYLQKSVDASQVVDQRSEQPKFNERVPKIYSSKYYFSVEDYSQSYYGSKLDMYRDSHKGLTKRRKSLLSSHLLTKINAFDEIIDNSLDQFSSSKVRKLQRSPVVSFSNEVDPYNESGAIINDPKLASFSNQLGHDRHRVFDNLGKRREKDNDCEVNGTPSTLDHYIFSMLNNALGDVQKIKADLRGANDGWDLLPMENKIDYEESGQNSCYSFQENHSGQNEGLAPIERTINS